MLEHRIEKRPRITIENQLISKLVRNNESLAGIGVLVGESNRITDLIVPPQIRGRQVAYSDPLDLYKIKEDADRRDIKVVGIFRYSPYADLSLSVIDIAVVDSLFLKDDPIIGVSNVNMQYIFYALKGEEP